MHVHDSLATIEFCPDRFEGFFSEIFSGIICKQDKTVGP